MTQPSPRRRGRHAAASSASRGASPAVIAGVIGAIVLLGGGGWAIAKSMTSDDSAASTSSTASASTSSSSASTTAQPSSSAASTTSSSTAAGASPALVACRDEVRAGEALAAAAVPVATRWQQHTSTQTRLDAGQLTADQAAKIWAESKKAGPGDLTRYGSAATAYGAKANSCNATGDVPAADKTAMQQCSRRAAALAAVATSIVAVKNDWASHLEAMKTKAQMIRDPAHASHYWANWDTLVRRAPGLLKTYDTAAGALKSAPSCPGA